MPKRNQPGTSSDEGAEFDLRAQIQARITARRTAAETVGRHQPVSRQLAPSEAAPEESAVAATSPTTATAVAAGAAADSVPADSTADSVPADLAAADSELRTDSTEAATGAAGLRRPPSAGMRALRTLAFLLAVALAVVGVRRFVVASYYIPSASMETTLHGCQHCQPDMVLVDKLSYRFGHVARTDVVVFDRPPLAPPEDKELIKRVIGLPGEVVSGHNGSVFIGNKALAEPYLNPACNGTGDFPAVTVPAGQYFVMGDNRCNSLDSRVFGTIPGSSIVGRSFSVIWPVKHLRWL